jgi:hypothetical protein
MDEATMSEFPDARVVLVKARANRAVLDGGWWPRSTDPAVELPGLIHALSERFAPIRYVLLNNAAWDGRFRRIEVDGRTVRTGWFASLDPALLVATTEAGDQIDVLVVPPSTEDGAANDAMARAADPDDNAGAPEILAAVASADPASRADSAGRRA